MRASAVLPTYNRPPDQQWLVEEAIESFLRQDYPDKELLVLNDRLLAWSPDRYVERRPRPRGGAVTVLTPPSIVAVLQAGYRTNLHPSAAD